MKIVGAKIFIIASKLYQLQIWAVCGRKSGRFRGLWALKWAFGRFVGVKVGVAGGLWALEWAWSGLWALEWAWRAVCGR